MWKKIKRIRKKKKHIAYETQKRDYISTFIPHVGEALKELLKLSDKEEKKIESSLKKILEKNRGKLEEIEAENIEFDKEFALEKGAEEDERHEE